LAWQGLALLLIAGSTIVACADSTTEPSVTVTTIVVTPANATLGSFGETAQLSATARDADGNVIAGVSFSWSSSDENCATVSTVGLVTAVGNGTATVTATAAGVSGTAAVTVAQIVASVTVTPASTTLTSIDETAQLAACRCYVHLVVVRRDRRGGQRGRIGDCGGEWHGHCHGDD
jgi:uncharacterized protein YjdB